MNMQDHPSYRYACNAHLSSELTETLDERLSSPASPYAKDKGYNFRSRKMESTILLEPNPLHLAAAYMYENSAMYYAYQYVSTLDIPSQKPQADEHTRGFLTLSWNSFNSRSMWQVSFDDCKTERQLFHLRANDPDLFSLDIDGGGYILHVRFTLDVRGCLTIL
jgi:hypothetical protein